MDRQLPPNTLSAKYIVDRGSGAGRFNFSNVIFVRAPVAPAGTSKGPNPFMNVSEPSGNELRPADRTALSGPGDPGDIRTLLLVLAAFVFFLYLIRPILLPFVVAGVIAYVCTPLLDWLAARTRLPRPLFAVLLFLILIGIALTAMTLAGQNLI